MQSHAICISLCIYDDYDYDDNDDDDDDDDEVGDGLAQFEIAILAQCNPPSLCRRRRYNL